MSQIEPGFEGHWDVLAKRDQEAVLYHNTFSVCLFVLLFSWLLIFLIFNYLATQTLLSL